MNLKYGKKYEPNSTLDSLICPQRLFDMLLGSVYTHNDNECFSEMEFSHSFLFSGRCGSGKRTVIDALAGTAELCQYELFEISVMEFLGNDSKSTLESINQFFNDLEEDRLFLFFEDIWLFNDDTRAGRFFFSKLKQLIKNSEQPILAVAAYDDSPANIPDYYRSAMQIVNIGEPSDLDRSNMIEATLSYFFNENVSLKFLVELTEGFTYGEVQNLIDCICMSVMGKTKVITDDEEVTFSENIEPNKLLEREHINAFVQDVKSSRYVPNEIEITKSVFNYPGSGTILQTMASTLEVESKISEVTKNDFDSSNFNMNLDNIKIDDSKPVDPKKTLEKRLPTNIDL